VSLYLLSGSNVCESIESSMESVSLTHSFVCFVCVAITAMKLIIFTKKNIYSAVKHKLVAVVAAVNAKGFS
jgi:hypothetical protein